MKILIGILILLFVLTTISFSETAYAVGECGHIYAVSYTEYLPSEETESDSSYNSYLRSHYMESKDRSEFIPSSEYEGAPAHNRDWDPSPEF